MADISQIKLPDNTTYNIKDVTARNAIAAATNAAIDAIYPVGSIYISFNSSMPTSLTTGRTWVAVTGGYVLKTVTSGTGGATTAAGNTGSTTLTVNQIPSHHHGLYYGDGSAANGTGGTYHLYMNGGSASDTMDTGGGKGHTHTAGMPANVAVYMWKRTA